MDFSSIPSFLDPSNWQQTPSPQHQHQHQHQQINHHHGGGSNNPNSSSNPLVGPPPLPPPIQMPGQAVAGMGGSIRPGSMAERARMANIPMPEAALKCPRCDSTNTKFCYFNNYNLSQPRHFCKTCRRYWTRGGALRNVPVGGGCRRNKRSKSSSSAGASSSKTTPSSSATATSSSTSALATGASSVADILGMAPPPLSALRFMNNTPLHHLATDFVGGGLGLTGNYGDLGFQLGSLGMEHWRNMGAPPPPQFPFLGGLEGAAAGPGMYGHPYEGAELSSLAIGHVRAKGPESTSAAVKMEESSRQFRNMGGGEQYNWGGGGSSSSGGGNAWTDISGLNNNSSCSTTSAL